MAALSDGHLPVMRPVPQIRNQGGTVVYPTPEGLLQVWVFIFLNPRTIRMPISGYGRILNTLNTKNNNIAGETEHNHDSN